MVLANRKNDLVSRRLFARSLGWTLSLLLGLTGACSPPAGKRPASVVAALESHGEAAEYAVYDAIIEAEYLGPGRSLVVIDHQTGFQFGSTELAKQVLPELGAAVVADFEAKNRRKYALLPLFQLSVRYVFIDPEEVDEIFQGRNGWTRYRALYPGASGMMAVSRVGFSPEMDSALVYVAHQSDYLSGSGVFFLLTRVSGTWTITGRVGAAGS